MKTATLSKPLPPNGIGTSKPRKRGEQAIVLSERKDSLGRVLYRVTFTDGEERLLLEQDIEPSEAICIGPASDSNIIVTMHNPWGLNLALTDFGGES